MYKFFFRSAANLIQAFRPKLNILIYHRVMPEADPLRPWEVDAEQFRKHMEWISGVFNVTSLSEAVEHLKSGTLKRRSLAITFDDGYMDNATHALPILKEFGYHATFFCTSAWLEGGLMWNDQVIEAIRRWPEKSITISELELDALAVQTTKQKINAIDKILPKLKYQEHNIRQEIADALTLKVDGVPDLMMRTKHIQLLHQEGMEIGGHTHSHPIIANLNDEALEAELKKNKQILEDIIGHKLLLFAYPNGKIGADYLKKQSLIVNKAGFVAAASTDWGTSSTPSSLMQLKRFTPWDRSCNSFLSRLLQNHLTNTFNSS